jgi:hypothetical protein
MLRSNYSKYGPLKGDAGSSIPHFAPLPLHRDAGQIADLDPGAALAGLIGAVYLLRHDALGAKLARTGEHGRPPSAMCSLTRMPALVLRSSCASAAFRSMLQRPRLPAAFPEAAATACDVIMLR